MRLLTFLLFIAPLTSVGQIGKDVVKWTFSVRETNNHSWTLQAKADIKTGFHIFALDPGGDGTLIATSFDVTLPENIQWIEDWQESAQPIAHTFEDLDMTVNYFEHSVTFSHAFKAKSGEIVSGEVSYQSCNDKMCFPPATQSFSITIP